ncbi:MAG: hypothetical protein ACOYD1_07980 [Candidatus Nanopelagicales bacterium]
MLDLLDEANARLAGVLGVHRELIDGGDDPEAVNTGLCAHCLMDWPCLTARAAGAEEAP